LNGDEAGYDGGVVAAMMPTADGYWGQHQCRQGEEADVTGVPSSLSGLSADVINLEGPSHRQWRWRSGEAPTKMGGRWWPCVDVETNLSATIRVLATGAVSRRGGVVLSSKSGMVDLASVGELQVEK